MIQITDHLAAVHARVGAALARAGRGADETAVLAVSKQQPAEAIAAAFEAGQAHFGESYVQEAVTKIKQLERLPIHWHFIGRVQSNKTRALAENFEWVHTVDSERAAARLDRQRPHFAPPLNVLIQVNQANEPQKGGVAESDIGPLARFILERPRLKLRGLMTMPPEHGSAEHRLEFFARLRALQAALAADGIATDALSMGMSADLEQAIEAGATWVRVGTAIFGPRPRR